MTSPISLQANIKISGGMCPHGHSLASCPICKKQSASMYSAVSFKPHKQANNDWSYQKCYVAGLQIKAALQRRVDNKAFLDKNFQLSLNIYKNIQNIYDRFNQFVQKIKIPIIQSSAQLFINTAFSQISKLINSIANLHKKSLDMLLQAGEKLTNILGEIKNFLERKFFENFKKKAKKFLLFCLSVIDDENYKNDETLAVFKSRELRKFIVKFLKKNKNNEHQYNNNK